MTELPLLRGGESGRGRIEVKTAIALKGLLRRTREAGLFARQQASPWEKFSLHLPATSQFTSQSQQQGKTTQPCLLLGTLGRVGGILLPGLCFAGCCLDRSRSAFAPCFSFPSHGLDWLFSGAGCDFVLFFPLLRFSCAFILTAPSGQGVAAKAAISVSLLGARAVMIPIPPHFGLTD